MLKNIRSTAIFGVLGALGIALIACNAGVGSTSTAIPEKEAEVVSPSTGLKVTANIASVTLGDECANSGSLKAPSAGDCAGPGCGGGCASSNVQIAFNAGAGTKGASVEVVSIQLLDAKTASIVNTLSATKAQIWNGNGYSDWDQKVSPGGDLKASYALTSPTWSTIDGSESGSGSRSSYSRAFKLHVTLRIDGVEVVLESTDLNRQPQAAT